MVASDEEVLTDCARWHAGNTGFSEDGVVSCSSEVHGGRSYLSNNNADGGLQEL
jgi:hypothetical protein